MDPKAEDVIGHIRMSMQRAEGKVGLLRNLEPCVRALVLGTKVRGGRRGLVVPWPGWESSHGAARCREEADEGCVLVRRKGLVSCEMVF